MDRKEKVGAGLAYLIDALKALGEEAEKLKKELEKEEEKDDDNQDNDSSASFSLSGLYTK